MEEALVCIVEQLELGLLRSYLVLTLIQAVENAAGPVDAWGQVCCEKSGVPQARPH